MTTLLPNVDPVERYGLQAVEVDRSPRTADRTKPAPDPGAPMGLGDRIIDRCIQALLLTYLGAVVWLSAAGVFRVVSWFVE